MNYKIGATGFEPEPDFLSSDCAACGYADCDMCRAANALHSGRLKWLELALNDADLQQVVVAWDGLPETIRRAVGAVVESVDDLT